MFVDNELKTTKKYIESKKRDILNNTKGSDVDYIRNLQTIILLENAVDREIVVNSNMVNKGADTKPSINIEHLDRMQVMVG